MELKSMKLYQTFCGNEPSGVLTSYPDDATAVFVFSNLCKHIKDDIDNGTLKEEAADITLYCCGYMFPDGSVKGLKSVMPIATFDDVICDVGVEVIDDEDS